MIFYQSKKDITSSSVDEKSDENDKVSYIGVNITKLFSINEINPMRITLDSIVVIKPVSIPTVRRRYMAHVLCQVVVDAVSQVQVTAQILLTLGLVNLCLMHC